MQRTSPLIAHRTAAEPIAIAGNPAVKWPPYEHAARKVQERRRPPQPPQPPRKVADRFCSPMPPALAVDDHHLLHHPIMRKVRPAPGDLWIVQRKIRQLLLAIPPGKLANLGRAHT